MIPRITLVAALALLCLPLRGFADDQSSLQSTAEKLYASLSDDQRKQATVPFDSPERTKEVFTGGERGGIQIKKLDAEQQKLATGLLTAFTSDYGKQKALAIADQTINNPADDPGFGRYYLCFFGAAEPGKTYAWRIAEHHLTLVHVEVEQGEPKSFGPILLGANPPVLFDVEEEKMIALFAAMTPEERRKAQQQGKGISTNAFKGQGVSVGDLGPSAKEAAKAVLENRLSFFSEPVRRRIQKILDSQGGLDTMHVAFFGEATKKCRDGGRWDFKLAGPQGGFLCDYEGSRAHVHLSMKGTLLESRTSGQ